MPLETTCNFFLFVVLVSSFLIRMNASFFPWPCVLSRTNHMQPVIYHHRFEPLCFCDGTTHLGFEIKPASSTFIAATFDWIRAINAIHAVLAVDGSFWYVDSVITIVLLRRAIILAEALVQFSWPTSTLYFKDRRACRLRIKATTVSESTDMTTAHANEQKRKGKVFHGFKVYVAAFVGPFEGPLPRMCR